jgi:hypothetical protein
VSGQKVSYVQITDREYDRFMKTSREVEKIESRVQKQLKQRENQLRKEFNNQFSSMKTRVNKQQNMIQNLSVEMQNMEKDFQESVSVLDKKIDKVNYKVNNLINAIDIKEQNKKSKATEWLKNTSDLLSIIDTYNHRKFADGKFDKLSTKYELCKSNFEDENYEASIASLQSLWQEAVELRFELEYLENEWNEYLKNAIESNNNLIATCEAQEIVKIVFDTENEVKELDIDIDFWCNGKLSKLKEEANKQKQVLLDNTQNLELKELKEFINQSEELTQKVIALTQESKESILLSQSRSDMASDILESLEQSGFVLKDHCFEENDERKSIHLKLSNMSNDEIVTIITPIDNKENKLDIHFFGDSNERFKQTQLQNIFTKLQNVGLKCSTPKCVEGTEHHSTGNEKVRDFSLLKQQKGLLQ